jgi:hypothetical protein
MSLSKRQKMLLGIFVVGLVGLVADRTILRPQGGPKAASAESLAPASNAARPGGAPAEGDQSVRPPLAERLNKLLPDTANGAAELRDPFALPVSWPGSAGNKEKVPDVAGVFARKHQLKAVVVQGQDVCAQVDDSFLVPGQTMDGFRLVSINDRSVIFERVGKQVVLDLVIP